MAEAQRDDADSGGGGIRVLLVDDHRAMREGLRALLDVPEIHVVGEAASGREAVACVREAQPDIILLDVRMPDMDGLTAIPLIKEELPSVAVIILTSFESSTYVAEALAASAAGYVLKGVGRVALVRAAQTVHEGGAAFDPVALGGLIRSVRSSAGPLPDSAGHDLVSLSAGEQETLKLVASGRTDQQIAEQIHSSVATVENTVQGIIEKLGAPDRI